MALVVFLWALLCLHVAGKVLKSTEFSPRLVQQSGLPAKLHHGHQFQHFVVPSGKFPVCRTVVSFGADGASSFSLPPQVTSFSPLCGQLTCRAGSQQVQQMFGVEMLLSTPFEHHLCSSLMDIICKVAGRGFWFVFSLEVGKTSSPGSCHREHSAVSGPATASCTAQCGASL